MELVSALGTAVFCELMKGVEFGDGKTRSGGNYSKLMLNFGLIKIHKNKLVHFCDTICL